MRSPAVIKLDPVANHTAGMLQRLEAMAMDALLFQSSNQALDQAVLLWRMRRDEFLS